MESDKKIKNRFKYLKIIKTFIIINQIGHSFESELPDRKLRRPKQREEVARPDFKIMQFD